MRTFFRIALALALVAFATAAFAGETGSISGFVKDGTGLPVPGAMVKLTGAQAPQNTVSGASGAYRFPVVLPGAWVVTAELKGLGIASQKVQVFVDNDVQVSLTLVQTAKAEIVVTGSVAEIDKKASEVNFNYTDNVIKDLPLARSYEGLIKLVPGTPATDGSGFVSISGGTRQDNKYMIDGVNITNPGYGNLGIDPNQLDIADFNVKKGGITAEFGRTSGAMFNAVTKSGTNDWNGSILGNFSPSSFQAERKYTTQRETTNYNGQGSVGFPIMKDTLFGYASAAYYYTKNAGQTATSANVTTVQPDTIIKNGDYFGKLTAFIGQPLLINAGFRAMPVKTADAFDSIYDFPTAGWKNDATQYVGNITADWFASKDTVFEAKYVYLDETDAVEAQNPLTSRPMTIDPAHLGAYGQWNNPARNSGNEGVYPYLTTGDTYKRNEVKATLSQYFDIGPTQNQFKLGGGYEDTDYQHARVSNGWGTFLVGSTCPAAVCGTAKSGMIRARFYGTQPDQFGKARTYAAFIQDTVTWKNVTLYLGVLLNKDDFGQVCKEGGLCGSTVNATTTRYNFMTFNWGDEVQPRFGLTWNANLLQGDKFYSSYGQYANLDQKSTSRSFAPYRIRYDQAWFDKTTGAYLGQQILGSSAGKYIPPDLKAPYYQEWIIGYSAAFLKEYSFDVYYQYRNLKNPFEDVPIDMANYFGSFQAANFPDARRVYRALTIDVQKRYSNGWYADMNLTLSKLYGNWDEDYGTALFNTSSLLEDDPTLDIAQTPNRFGRLGQDRPVIFKMMGSYDFPFGLTFGGFLRVQSGTPWEPRGAGPNSASSRFLLPAGTYRLPTWTTFDLLGAYNFKLNASMVVRIEARVSNLFNTQTVLGVSQIQYLDGYKDGVPASTMGPQGTTSPNANYGVASSWAAPRRLVLTARLDF
ncbi:MAG TPA: carboxypeptidase regulatory-like domain-containing protein [Thermoanaerobaculia bacterium]|nr:carboxypeptidase regulatory-like domain-containing protein [Thermoanaerobaculia bacterium]HQR65971.1 carboxypeptidase regulatory-like domain-containing protein [Thermoanaerobaculia bacterium]